MAHPAVQRLLYLCDTLPDLLQAMSREDMTARPRPDKWSRLEILGHLLDSAVNNHSRFVRVQFEENPAISYDADQWNAAGYYRSMEPAAVIAFWEGYNRHLAVLIGCIPEASWNRTCDTGGPAPVTLDFLISDYVVHMEHHLKEITDYK